MIRDPPNYSYVGSLPRRDWTPETPRADPLRAMYGNEGGRQGSSNQPTTSSSSSYASGRGLNRLGERFPAFAGSRYGRQSNLSLQQTATTRMLQFSSRPQPRLSKANFANTDVHSFIEHIHQLIRAEAFDETVMETHIDEESIHYLATLFATTTVATARPIPTHWTVDWDVATIIEALEELYPLRAEHRHLSIGYRWEAVVTESRATVEIQSSNMEQVRQSTLVKWNRGLVNIGPVPETRRYKIVKSLSGCFTHRDNPHRSKTSNEHFQRELDEMLEGDAEYSACPTLPRLCDLVARLIHKWEKLYHEYVSHSVSLGSTASSSTLGKRDRHSKATDMNKQSKSSDKEGDNPICQGCNRFGHTRETCVLRSHPDFNHSGAWSGSATERTIEAYLNTTDFRHKIKRIQLMKHLRADGTRLPRTETTDTAHPPTPPRGQDSTYRRDRDDGGESGRGGSGRGRNNDRRGRGGRGSVHFDKSIYQGKGTGRTDIITHLSCNCGESDTHSSYRQCLVSIRHLLYLIRGHTPLSSIGK